MAGDQDRCAGLNARCCHIGAGSGGRTFAHYLGEDLALSPAGPQDSALTTVVDGTRYTFNTDESGATVQTVREPVAAPVRNVNIEAVNDGVRISWARRLDDFSYAVHRRDAVDVPFEVIAPDITESSYVDTSPIPGAWYTVNSITAAKENGAVTLGAGEAFITRPGESIRAVEVGLEEGTVVVRGRSSLRQLWSGLDKADNVPQGIRDVFDRLADAMARSDLDGAMSVFDEDYQDPQGWNHEYVRRALQLLMERGAHPRFDYDIRIASVSESAARVNTYLRFSASIDSPYIDRRMYTPATSDSVTWITFEDIGGEWRITGSNPAMVNMRDLTAFIAGDPMGAGLTQPDRYRGLR